MPRIHAQSAVPQPSAPSTAELSHLMQWQGRTVASIHFEGVSRERLEPLSTNLPQQAGKPLDPLKIRQSLRELYDTGLFESIQVGAAETATGVELTFTGLPRQFVGVVSVGGARGATMNAQLTRATRLNSGTRLTEARLQQAIEHMRATLADNGFSEPVISYTLQPRESEPLVDVDFQVASGPQAQVGAVALHGDSGMSAEEFRRHAHLREGSHVDRETINRALAGALHHYQGEERFEAEIKIESQHYDPTTHRSDYHFLSNRGPQVLVSVDGLGLSPEKLRRVIPIFEEGSVDEDLLNEGARRLREYCQRLGFFDSRVTHEQKEKDAEKVQIFFHVQLGQRRKLVSVAVAGNHYFNSNALKDLLNTRPADAIDHHGVYSQALVSADVAAIEGLYRNNGFAQAKVSVELIPSAVPQVSGDNPPAATHKKILPLAILYRVNEGQQTHIAHLRIEGNDHYAVDKLLPQLNSTAGQLYSPQYLAGDRDALLTYYLSRGFDQATVNVTPQAVEGDPLKVDVVFHVNEGQQIFVRRVLLTGLQHTRPETVRRAITLHPGDPLDQNALEAMQRNLYDFALFNEVDVSVENPTGSESHKTVLVNAVEARRWTLTYGGGFEAQTGTPQNNCGSAIVLGESCDPNGKTGVSWRGILDITRNNLNGGERSASLRGTYGLLEQKVDLLYQIPHFQGNRNFGLTFSGGYASSKDVTTYVASRLQAGARFTESFRAPNSFLSKANTIVYEYDFRRVKVAQDSLQVGPYDLKALSTAVRVAGPSLTWIRDTRDSPLDAHRGTYTSFQEFVSDHLFSALVGFNRVDMENSNYWSFGKDRLVIARNTRYGQERAFKPPSQELLPLPERLYAGGATSLRGFAQNGAGPRDPETGYPIGGAGTLINSTELRLPPPTLPWVGNAVSIVLFHDMGNVFTNAGDAWASVLRARQPGKAACRASLVVPSDPANAPAGPIASTGPEGECDFNYFSHTPGVGMRYHTPAGPLRLDFSYNLNPPIYPVIYNYSLAQPASQPHMGQANHFNFFFSLGQTF
ncbi:POTRA domain-containing protein [Telmatobacter bradus]|uniref:POTRA domain-containing protein n=1 Tax=Telmatobacter bradus TaxID=474953 RepID=UPI003B42976E